MRVGKVIGKYKMAKHFELDITETAFAYHRKADAIAAEAALDGLYIVRTSVPTTELDAEHTVRAYKGLSVVERAFRSLKTVDLKVRPIYHYAGARVRAHVFLCMLAYYVEWHMRQRLKPLCSTTRSPTWPRLPAHRWWRRPRSHHRPKTKPDANAPPRASVCTASGPCSTIWPRLPTTASSLPWLMPSPSTSSLDRPRCSEKLSRLAWNVPRLFHSEKQQGRPVLKDIPALGVLFGRTSTESEELELIVIVTARLVEPNAAPEDTGAPQATLRANGYHY